MRTHSERMSPTTSLLKVLGVTCAVGSVAAFVLATFIYVSGVEIAFLLHLASLGVFTFGIGALSVARDRDAVDARLTSATTPGPQIS